MSVKVNEWEKEFGFNDSLRFQKDFGPNVRLMPFLVIGRVNINRTGETRCNLRGKSVGKSTMFY